MKINKNKIAEIVLVGACVMIIFCLGRLYQIKKDQKVVDTIQEQFTKLNEKYVDVCENSVYIGKKD